MSKASVKTGLNDLTVSCRQCGSASMERLDRKEYRCTHCGAITVISDDDADRVETLLRNALHGSPSTAANPLGPTRLSQVRTIALTVGALLFFSVFLIVLPSRSRRHSSVPTGHDSVVPLSQVVLSPLQWKQGSSWEGTYTGLVYNHSGFTIEVPRYGLTTYRKGLKGDTAIFDSDIQTLQPGEYTAVKFRVISSEPHDRYEVEPPTEIDKSTDEIANVVLSQAQFVHQQGTAEYRLIGVVQNTFNRPVTGQVQLMLYDGNKQVAGTASGYFSDIRPGEKALLSLNASLDGKDLPVPTYEYLMNAHFTDRTR
ncbi:hypothetical protein Terro_0392 [Terriglobus roseus DSM 18391]|uniref:Uncharacterized protein n=1 Tax=Terriglobus roseus (strain DSM 18391 / NRRL B-41598 / KBS 63) TaxID=926566 RepID=I3ZBX2_TERRK|nr:hypothetical protein [Terriglobus roseus]AFL86740.1 hypothetical protein Terro_0392 [Terriglobus roseus DSM 18391]